MNKQEIERIVKEVVDKTYKVIDELYDPNNHMESIAKLRAYREKLGVK